MRDRSRAERDERELEFVAPTSYSLSRTTDRLRCLTASTAFPRPARGPRVMRDRGQTRSGDRASLLRRGAFGHPLAFVMSANPVSPKCLVNQHDKADLGHSGRRQGLSHCWHIGALDPHSKIISRTFSGVQYERTHGIRHRGSLSER